METTIRLVEIDGYAGTRPNGSAAWPVLSDGDSFAVLDHVNNCLGLPEGEPDLRWAVSVVDRKLSTTLGGVGLRPGFELTEEGKQAGFCIYNVTTSECPIDVVAMAVHFGLIDGVKWRRQLEDAIRKYPTALINAARAAGISPALNK